MRVRNLSDKRRSLHWKLAQSAKLGSFLFPTSTFSPISQPLSRQANSHYP
jgi:hypothetical protein